ncbi:MAG: metal-dependent hydrolase [Candidatus Riflebacteria bacterium]|nr:metal-dependent hydrolase [Candidatus Riflebacteria bacterium]
MFQNYIGYTYRGEHRIKARGEQPFADSVARRKSYEARWKETAPAEGCVKVKFLGHAGFQVVGSRVLFFDPFITGNRWCTTDLGAVRGADVVLVTHDHPHHVGDSFEICRRTGGTLVGITGLAEGEKGRGVRFQAMNLGGKIDLDGVVIHMVQSVHVGKTLPAAGYVVELDGCVLYHAGDTALFEGLGQIGTDFEVDVACLPIGDRFGMGPREAARAVELIKPRFVVPMHYGTRPEIEQDPDEFRQLVAEHSEVRVLHPGESLVLNARKVHRP